MLFSFFDTVIRSLTLLFTVISTDNFEPALKDFKKAINQIDIKILINTIFHLFSSESYSGHVGGCFLESGRLLPYLKAIF